MHIINLKLSMGSASRPSSFHHSNMHFLRGSLAIHVIQFTLSILLPSPYHVQDVFLPQSLPDLFTSHFVQSTHSLDPSHHAHLGSLHSPLPLLCQTPHLTAVQQRGHHRSIDYSQFCAYVAPSFSAPSHSFLQPFL